MRRYSRSADSGRRTHPVSAIEVEYAHLTRRGQIQRMRRVAEQALALFGVEPESCSLLAHAFNTTFAITGPDDARYVLHILRPEEDARPKPSMQVRVESELWWLDQVRTELDLCVPSAVRTADGDGVVQVAMKGMGSPRLCTLFHWIDGHAIHRLKPIHLQAVGSLTARMHNHSERLRVPAWFDRPRVDRTDAGTEDEVVRLFTDYLSRQAADVMRSVFQRMREAEQALGNGSDAYGLIHADVHQKNYISHRKEVRLIDFGDCGWGHYLYDLAVTVSELEDGPQRTELRQALLAGYRRERNLSPAQEALIDAFVMLREVQNLTWVLRARDDPSYQRRAAQLGERVIVLEKLLATGIG
jgi:Ser/Thr protein kinase RdoA (MazF antagonist)